MSSSRIPAHLPRGGSLGLSHVSQKLLTIEQAKFPVQVLSVRCVVVNQEEIFNYRCFLNGKLQQEQRIICCRLTNWMNLNSNDPKERRRRREGIKVYRYIVLCDIYRHYGLSPGHLTFTTYDKRSLTSPLLLSSP